MIYSCLAILIFIIPTLAGIMVHKEKKKKNRGMQWENPDFFS